MTRPISIAVMALGGQGGGVLAQWIVDLAEANGYLAQYTSIAGVAQRTGATIYFIEIFPESVVKATGKMPVLALMPAPGDVDIVIASELMEAGRAVTRRFVSPDLTTLIASSHRVYSVSEKQALGDGRADDTAVLDALRQAAKRLVLFDMNQAAEDTASVISAVLFGALSGSGALPFARDAYEQVITASGKAVASNLAGFARGFAGTQSTLPETAPSDALPASVHDTLQRGIARLQDYQDAAYAALYVERLEKLRAVAAGDRLLNEAARYLALWMSYEDVIRVADLKTRAGRLEKIGAEARALPGQPYYSIEYFHPRYEEVCDTLPAALGATLLKSNAMRRLLAPFFAKGRQIHTAKLSGFLPLYVLARLRRWRRGTLRFKKENAAIETWLAQVMTIVPQDYELAVAIAELPRLIKGYGDTHERGMDRFNRIMALLPRLVGKADAAAKVMALRDAALQDEEGRTFAAELQLYNNRGSAVA
ncbi:MAG: indolepyruvate oxidoreductase subunit beta family protein [Sphingomonadales bacterium]|nr:indolepyruvate oxidoreductase subunit beta family protein [Sphingomonadales bacterium]